MSAIIGSSSELGPDRIARYRTKVKIVVNSHNSDRAIDLSKSVINISSNKNIKSIGQFSFALTSERNWFNILYPNDYINLYIDRADGQGWVRTFFGFIDHIEQVVDTSSGMPSSIYSVQCSDFQKAAERTQIYFNPHVAARADFNGGFVGTPNIGGLALMTRGVQINGSPSDLAINVLLLLLGFGSQFILPTSYSPLLASRIRQQRADFILNRLSDDARRQVAGDYTAYLERVKNELGIETDTAELLDPDSTNASQVQLAERRRFSREVADRLGNGAAEVGAEAFNVLNTTTQSFPPTLLDVIDIFTFVERGAIDGYTIGAPMWEHQGNIMSFLRFISNEVVNELFFDLRLMNRNGGLQSGINFSKEMDDLGGNAASDGVTTGSQYVPAMVMREYPFATVHSVDGSDISLTIREQAVPGGASTSQAESLGLLHFGAIFSNEPNVPGRHIITVPNINPEDRALGQATRAASKHLDTAVVYDHEIITTRFSRSDTDHYNLFEFYSDALIGQNARFFMQDLLPIITPIHIVRHGLRVRSLTTRFGRFSLDTVNRMQPQQPPPEEEEQEEATPEEPVSSPRYVSPITYEAGVKGMIAPNNVWHYRYRRNNSPAPPHPRTRLDSFNGQNIIPSGEAIWRFHNGVDYVANRGEPVYAVTDGWVVTAAPPASDGGALVLGFSGYGGTVIIYHGEVNDDNTVPEGSIFSLYAHLDTIESKFLQGQGRSARSRMAKEIRADGQYQRVRVRAGEQIGTVGSTGFRDRNMGAHLHFEILKKNQNRVYPSRNRTLTPDILTSAAQHQAAGGWAPNTSRVSAAEPSTPSEEASISQDPVRVLREWGVTVHVERPGTVTATSDDPDPTDVDPTGHPEVYSSDANETDDDPQTPPSPSPEAAEEDTNGQNRGVLVGHVDTPSTRRQLARWALLNDHWYQHNLEYLSGTIEMRGAPEIRVGYRLDMADRNLSFYIEGVSHSWSYGKDMRTTLHVTRGQPNNPYPSYVLPHIEGFTPTETQRKTGSRLAQYFIVPDPIAVRRSLKIDRSTVDSSWRSSPLINSVDSPGSHDNLSAKYGETIEEASSVNTTPGLEDISGSAGTSTSTMQTNPLGGADEEVVSELFPTLEDL